MSKIRVYELAKKYGVTSKDVIKILVKEGIMVKSHMSTVDEQVESLIKHSLRGASTEKKKPPRKKGKPGKKPAPRKKKPGKKKKKTKEESDQKAVRESVRRTLAKLDIAKKSKRSGRKKKKKQEEIEEENVIKLPEYVTISEMAEKLEVDPTEIIKKCMELGMMVTINQRIDSDAMSLIADEYGVEIEFADVAEEDLIKKEAKQIDPERMVTRPPVVTIMGHVDHGKTSLLDTIRESNMVAGEKGGITQHIGAYLVDVDGRKISFVDTPGHEAFTAMRARGAEITDIVVLIVAADDGVMSQTVEAINHARVADVPIVVAINKIDLPNADVSKVKRELLEHNIVLEEYGGDVMAAEISAVSGEGVDEILEMILLQAEVKDLKADPEAMVQGAVIEAEKEKGRGIICTVLIQQGTLRVGDYYIVGNYSGRVKAMMDERGNTIVEAPPSTPVVVMGTKGVPQAGDMFFQVEEEKAARQIAKKRQQVERERERRSESNITLEDLYEQIQSGKVKELLLVIKGDTDGSVEALVDSLESLDTDEVKIEVIHTGVGMINESDILLASASNAIVIGFHESVAPSASKVAKSENVDIRLYEVIYQAIDDMKAAMSGLLEPEIVEKDIGEVEVRQVFHVSGVGMIAGSFVKSGEVRRNAFARVLRGDEIIFEGKIDSLKRFKEDVGVVQSGYECGVGIEDYEDVEEGDILQIYVKEEKSRSI
ncbi:MAG: translation initiation factor IF-2 [Candidatus Latescibacteria bacterium]|nr:translation initiation factor IF-2 [bacterium]MBD3424562.1 translation initiation factor IF-2 [Candidatus Latescibacterota bacterium]